MSEDRRDVKIERSTRETSISLELRLDGAGEASVKSGVGFLDHMISAMARFARFDVVLLCKGDLEVDDHHSAEDCAIVIGQAIDRALGERRGIARFGSAYAPLDEALARAVVDLSGRPWPEVHLGLTRPMIGDCASENLTHFVQTLAMNARAAVHVDVLRGQNNHHMAEAAFKALGLALRAAAARDGSDAVPSTKGVL